MARITWCPEQNMVPSICCAEGWRQCKSQEGDGDKNKVFSYFVMPTSSGPAAVSIPGCPAARASFGKSATRSLSWCATARARTRSWLKRRLTPVLPTRGCLSSKATGALRVMQREGNLLSRVLRDAWDKGNLATMTKNAPARATGACISIIGHITAAELRECLDRTEMANGGRRWWFLCPRTGRRTTKLFLPNDGWHFWSRHGYGLGYACQREDRFSRLQRRAAKLNSQLGG